jgi:hypothetical protein
MNGVPVGEGSTESAVVIPPGETRTIRTTARIDNAALDEWWVTHLERNQVTTLRLDFAARVDLQATTVRVPLDPLTYTETIETDLFGTKPETGTDTTTTTTTSASPTTSASAPIGTDDGLVGVDDGPA